jgi:site-specific DNA-methyltransferase (adenine-specific)
LFDTQTLAAIRSSPHGGPPHAGAEVEESLSPLLPLPVKRLFSDAVHGVSLYRGDCRELIPSLVAAYPAGLFDMVFADPPYFLSNGGSTCQGGRRVLVNKGTWDRSGGWRTDHAFHLRWLHGCQRLLKPNGTLWVTGTYHSIHSVGFALQKLGFRLLNEITWEKPNPPPNLSCRCFTHSTETLLWAARTGESVHRYNDDLMRGINGGRPMQTIWRLTGPTLEERAFGEHPTQKPLALVQRCLLAATQPGDHVLDPFLGTGTTAVACLRTGRKCTGIEAQPNYARIAIDRVMAEFAQGGDLFTPRYVGATVDEACAPASPT